MTPEEIRTATDEVLAARSAELSSLIPDLQAEQKRVDDTRHNRLLGIAKQLPPVNIEIFRDAATKAVEKIISGGNSEIDRCRGARIIYLRLDDVGKVEAEQFVRESMKAALLEAIPADGVDSLDKALAWNLLQDSILNIH